MNDGLALLERRVRSLPEALDNAARGSVALPFDPARVRCLLTTGIGSSEAHARFLARVVADRAGLPARFASVGALAGAPPADSERDVLIAFSQGLSPNLSFALQRPEDWAALLLVTAKSAAGGSKASELARLRARGIATIEMPAAEEFGTLARVVGPMAGFATSLSLARAIASGLGRRDPALELDIAAARVRIQAAPEEVSRALGSDRECDALFARPLAIVASGGYSELCSHIATKFLEGLWLEAPGMWDVLEFAHGPFQQLYERDATVLYLARADAPGEQVWIERVRSLLVPERHRFVVLRAELPGPAAVLDHEAQVNEVILRCLRVRSLDPSKWPGRGRDAALYETAASQDRPQAPGDGTARRLETATWPEIARAIERGQTTAILPLGSTEQHGLHLPFATDTWIGEALARRLCERVDDAIALPALSLGCASEHLDFPGTLTLREETLERLLIDVVRSLAHHSFERLFVFSAHGGNVAAIRSMRARLCEASSLEVSVYGDLDGLAAIQQRASLAEGVAPGAAGHHAGEFETSILLALAPSTVRVDRAQAGSDAPDDVQSIFYPSLRDSAPSGVVGDPRAASAERASRYLDAWVDELLSAYRAAFER